MCSDAVPHGPRLHAVPNLSRRPQDLLDEWHKHFPPSLGAIGTPRHVAATLERYTKELMDLRNELEAERAKRAQEVAGVLKSMDAQLQASSLGVMSERRKLSYAQQQQTKDFECALKDAEAQARAKLAAFTPKIGYPAKWRDYSRLAIVRGDALGNALRDFRGCKSGEAHSEIRFGQ